jgi:hypothetical protein
MMKLLRLMPLVTGLATSQARYRIRDVKLGLWMSLALAVGAMTVYVCVMFAVVSLLIPSLGLAGAFLATGAGAFAATLMIALALKLYRKSVGRKWRGREQSVNAVAATALSLVPLLARRYTNENPKLALAAAGILGLVLVNLTAGKPRD